MFCMYTRGDILSWCILCMWLSVTAWTTVHLKGCCLYPVQLQVSTILEKQIDQIHRLTILCSFSISTGSPSSKYEHRRASALLRNIQNIRICMGKKPIVSVTYENERISIKISLPYLKCVLRLSCVVHGSIYGRFMGFYVNGFLSILYKVNLYIERKPFT